VPIAHGGDRYGLANGQTLCPACHARKTLRESRQKV
jgi:5-methylcytosine-specific restriction endonuclease McrA